MFIRKIDLQTQVFNDPPVDCRTEIRVFDGIGLDAQTDFVPAVDRIADGVSDLMGYVQIDVPGVEVCCLDGPTRLLEMIDSVTSTGFDTEICARLPLRVGADAVTRVVV